MKNYYICYEVYSEAGVQINKGNSEIYVPCLSANALEGVKDEIIKDLNMRNRLEGYDNATVVITFICELNK